MLGTHLIVCIEELLLVVFCCWLLQFLMCNNLLFSCHLRVYDDSDVLKLGIS